MRADTLIQNISDQCIPNLVAMKTFSPRQVVWIYSPEPRYEHVLQRLKSMCGKHITHLDWQVDVRNSEKMEQQLQSYFSKLKHAGHVVYHTTGGTKAMSLQGLAALSHFHMQSKQPIQAVVMNPKSQQFDVVFPKAENHAAACTSLSLRQIIQVHGNEIRSSGRDTNDLKNHQEALNRLRLMHPMLMRESNQISMSKKDDNGMAILQGRTKLADVIIEAAKLAKGIGVVQDLKIERHQIFSKQIGDTDLWSYIRNVWMEDWVAMVLATGDNRWQQAFSGIKINFRSPNNYQEFDFLGARKNQLVYWSCKNTGDLSPAQLFEVDALRDEVGGRDFHVAGLVHTAEAKSGMIEKAKRLGVHLVNILDNDAEEQLLELSCK